MSDPIRVVLVDDHAILREGLRAMIAMCGDIVVVGEAADGPAGVAVAERQRPDVVIMDIAMPGMGGCHATQIIRERLPSARVLILSQHENWQYVVKAMQAGASGYVRKRSAGSDLLTAIRALAAGETFVDPVVASGAVRALARVDHARPGDPSALTPRERQILSLIAEGRTGPEIASALSLSSKTVSWHRTNLMDKLDVHSAPALVRYAIDNGLASEPD